MVNDNGKINDDADFVDAYERRLAGGVATEVPTQWRDEIEQMVRVHARIAALPLPEVSPAVRSVVLTAAAQSAVENSAPQSIFARLAEYLFRPGPILVAASAAALLIAVSARNDKTMAPVSDMGAVAQNDRPLPVLTAEPKPSAAAVASPAPTAQVAVAAPAAVENLGAPVAPAQDPLAAAFAANDDPPLQNAPIEAKPASLGPIGGERESAEVVDNKGHYQKAAGRDQQFAVPPPKPAQVAGVDKMANAAVADKAGDNAGSARNDKLAVPAGSAMGMVANKKAATDEDLAENAAVKPADNAATKPAENAGAKPVDYAPLRKAEESQRPAYQAAANLADNRAAPSAAPVAQRSVATKDAPAADNDDRGKQQQAVGADSAAVQIARLRGEVEKTSEINKKLALLKALQAAALKAGDGKTAQWAKAQTTAAEAERVAPAKVNRAKATEPVQRKAGSASMD